jgi:uncharacterized protein YmfQ (DUF2313 family)
MSNTSEAYLQTLQALLPAGAAWNRAFETYADDGSIATPRSNLTLLLQAFSQEFERIYNRSSNLVAESNPLTTFETMYKKFEEAGLPDSCSPSATTVEQMRLEIIQRWSSVGGANISFISALLTASGYTFTLTEYLNPLKMGQPINQSLASSDWVNTLTISISGVQESFLRLNGGSASDYFHTWSQNSVFCFLNKIKPAHVTLNYVLV